MVQLDGGEAVLKLLGPGAPGEARLHAQTGQIEAEGRVRITSEMRPRILVGLAEMSFGKSIRRTEFYFPPAASPGRCLLGFRQSP